MCLLILVSVSRLSYKNFSLLRNWGCNSWSETCESDLEWTTVIGPQNVYQPIRCKLVPIVTCSLTFPAFKAVDMYFLWFFSWAPRANFSSFWLVVVITLVLVSRYSIENYSVWKRNYFIAWFTEQKYIPFLLLPSRFVMRQTKLEYHPHGNLFGSTLLTNAQTICTSF